MAIDPVCGMQVDESSPIQFTYQQTTYYFCCQHCHSKFSSSPEDYLFESHELSSCCEPTTTLVSLEGLMPSSNKSAQSVPEQQNAYYFCPMCEGVRQLGPGTCPICGMALEPETPQLALAGSDHPAENHELNDFIPRFWTAVIFTMPIFVIAMLLDFSPKLLPQTVKPIHWYGTELVLSLPVVFWCGYPFLERAVLSLKSGHFNMFTLIGLGVTTAWTYSVIAFLFYPYFPENMLNVHGVMPVYFEAATMITLLMIIGQVMELKSREKTQSSIKALLDLSPQLTTKLTDCGHEKEIRVNEVVVGDKLRIRPGNKIPVDGKVIEGESFVDESMVTGESIHKKKSISDQVVAGTVNQNGAFIMQAEKVGSDTLLSQIIQLVTTAQRSRAPIQSLVDKVSAYFVPIVVLVALLTFLIWFAVGPSPSLAYAIVNAVAVLIIACPCALGLATPMSMTVGMGLGAKQGILFKNTDAVQSLSEIDFLVLDKTGTLTQGEPELKSITPTAGYAHDDLLQLAASLEVQSEHPIGKLIVEYAAKQNIYLSHVDDFITHPGMGVTGKVEGYHIAIGNAALMESIQAPLDAIDSQQLTASSSHTRFFMSVNWQISAIIEIADPVKPESKETIEAIKSLGIRVMMLTGDDAVTARSIADQLGIEEIQSNLLPQDKSHIISDLQAEGLKVAMAGDGINDAPALTAANVGIAMGNGTNVAIESADITLLNGQIDALAKAIKLSQQTMKNVRQNLFFAFVYNTIGIPIAAGILYPLFGLLLSPMIAAAAMSLSSVSVISNALRLNHLKLYR